MMKNRLWRKFIVIFLSVVIIFLNTSFVNAATSIQGTITSVDSGTPFASGSVKVHDEDYNFVDMYRATSEGVVTFDNLSDGTYNMIAYDDSSKDYAYSPYEKVTILNGKISSGNVNFKVGKTQFTGTLVSSNENLDISAPFAFCIAKAGSYKDLWRFYTTSSTDGTFKLLGIERW